MPSEQAEIVENFVTLLGSAGNATVQRVGLSELWEQSPPADVEGESLQEFLGQSIFRSYCYDYSQEYQGFRESYRDRFGSEPFAEATTQFRW